MGNAAWLCACLLGPLTLILLLMPMKGNDSCYNDYCYKTYWEGIYIEEIGGLPGVSKILVVHLCVCLCVMRDQ